MLNYFSSSILIPITSSDNSKDNCNAILVYMEPAEESGFEKLEEYKS